MTDSDIDEIATFTLRHFAQWARLAALEVESEAAERGETEKAVRWQRIGERIDALVGERGVAAFAVASTPRRSRRGRSAKTAVAMTAPAPTAQQQMEATTAPTRVPYLRLVTG